MQFDCKQTSSSCVLSSLSPYSFNFQEEFEKPSDRSEGSRLTVVFVIGVSVIGVYCSARVPTCTCTTPVAGLAL